MSWPGHPPRLIYRVYKARGRKQLSAPIVVVWNNLNTHISAAMIDLMAARDWLTVFRLPPCAHKLNPVEQVWSHLKRSLANLTKHNHACCCAQEPMTSSAQSSWMPPAAPACRYPPEPTNKIHNRPASLTHHTRPLAWMIEARMRAVADSRPGEALVRRQRRSGVVLPLAAAVSSMVLLVGCSSGGIGHSARRSLSARPSSLAPALAGQSAEQILAEAIGAVRAAGSVHVVAHDAAGSKRVTFIDDVSATAGREVIRTNGGGRATFLMIAGVGYLRGNAAALENYYGIRAPVATQLSGRWISVHRGDRGYKPLTSQVTLSGFIDEIRMEAPLARRGSGLVGNQPAVVVQGTASAASGGIKEMLYIASTGRPLPLSLVGDVPGERLRAMFGNWGEALHLAPPATSIPISSLTS